MKKGWRKEILQILGILTCAYFLIMCLMAMQLHVQHGNVDLFYEDQDHEHIHFSHTSGYCYKGPAIAQIARQNANFSTEQSIESRILGSCTTPVSSADVEMDALWRTLDVSYPLALSVSGWLDVVQVYSWVTKPLTVIIVPHSHQDPGWLFTFEYYFETYSNKIINLIVEQLTKNPAWRFVWSEVCWLEKWWEKASQSQKDSFTRLVRNGQLEIVSGGWVMPDEAVVHYSAMLNQLIDGHQWLMTHVGTTPNISWSIDPFGHSPTMAYFNKRSGAKAMVIQRIHFGIKRHLAKIKTMEFQWRQIWDSGSKTDIMTHVLPFSSYAITHSCGPNTHVCCQFDFYQKKCYYGKKSIRSEEINERNVKAKAWLLWEQFQKKSELFRENVLLVPHGDDFRYSDPREWEKQFRNLEKLMAYINSNAEMNTKVRFGTLSEYFTELEKSQTRPFPTFTGDFFPYSDRSDQYWTGFYTSRPHLKYLARRIQSLLRSVEILYAAAVAKANKMSEQLYSLLKLLPDLNVGRQELALFQHHDAITGTSRKTVTENYKERLQHTFSKLKPVYEKVTQIYLEQSLSVTKNHTVTMISDWMSMPLKELRKKLVHISQKRKLVIFNPLGHSRREVLTLMVDKLNVKVTNSSTTLTIPHQISPVWEKAGFTEDLYELSFEVNLPALSLSEITVEKGEATQNTRLVFYTQPDSFFMNITLPGINIYQENSPYFSVSNGYLTAYFYTCNGRLQYVHYKSTGHLWRSEVKVVTYTSGKTWSTMFKDKGGAYTFVPDGPAETLSEPVDVLFLIDGPLFSRVVTVQPTITQTVTIYKTHNNMAKGVHIENKVNMQKLDNTELMMRVESDIGESKAEMCVDLNGFQQKRTEFTQEQVKMLEEAYEHGLRKGKTWMSGRQELAGKLNLTEVQVKNWLGNHHKSKSGRTKLIKRTTLPAVRPTAYSLFCKEYSKDHPGFNPSVWKMEWDSAGEEEKERYAKMARGMAEDGGSALADDPSSQRKTIRTLLKQLEWTSKRLEIMGLPNFALVAENNTVHSVGTGRGREFLDHEETELKFSKFCNQDCSTFEKSKVNELRKTVQIHMNELYRKASGKAGSFPYKMVRKGAIEVEGLPRDVLPLHPPSHYGEEKLQSLLSCASISINYPQSAEEPNTVPQEAFTKEQSASSASFNMSIDQPSTSAMSTRPSSSSSSQLTTTEIEDMENNLIGILGVTSELGTDVSVEERSLVSSAVYTEPNVSVKKIKKEMRKMTKRKGKSKGKGSMTKQKKMATDDNEPFYYVEEIIDKRKKNGKTEFLVKWEGYEDPTWEPERNIPSHIIEEFL